MSAMTGQEARDEIAQIVKTVSTKWGGPALREFENDPPIRKHFAIADAVVAAGYDSADQRIDAWLHVADHEAFAGLDGTGASMLDAVLDRITEMHEAWSAARKHPEPEITDALGSAAATVRARIAEVGSTGDPAVDETWHNGATFALTALSEFARKKPARGEQQ